MLSKTRLKLFSRRMSSVLFLRCNTIYWQLLLLNILLYISSLWSMCHSLCIHVYMLVSFSLSQMSKFGAGRSQTHPYLRSNQDNSAKYKIQGQHSWTISTEESSKLRLMQTHRAIHHTCTLIKQSHWEHRELWVKISIPSQHESHCIEQTKHSNIFPVSWAPWKHSQEMHPIVFWTPLEQTPAHSRARSFE